MVTVETFLQHAASCLDVIENLFVTSWGPIHAYAWSPGHVHILDAHDDETQEHYAFMIKFYNEQGHWTHDKTFDHSPEDDNETFMQIYDMITDHFKDMKRYDISKVDLDDLPF